ncbi:hypothetical protein SEA_REDWATTLEHOG_26 [Gordonia phage RedWattleHog]|uniref:Uncharacterized protein n=1 Tax=Gordonia phage Stormageddon TaxID=2656541 RepID=A0A649VQW5_9CAUD|nr:hypothetical protein KHQ86_gp024 [Gordonia phage Stormageddon]QGJ94887.1 hypothetical protein SEA_STORMAGEDDON_24 [Gordonia phage Stormageddon]QLF83530.1 hypothetical protein SEA_REDWATTLEHOG_26 [Gordonia phage RedWattleHog]
MTTNSIPITDAAGKLQEIHLPDYLKEENLDGGPDPVALFEQAIEG